LVAALETCKEGGKGDSEIEMRGLTREKKLENEKGGARQGKYAELKKRK